MINPLYFDKTALAGSSPCAITRVVDSHRDSFVRFCAQELSLENYVAFMCCGAFAKNPTWLRLQTFYVVFLKGAESPMEINVSRSQAATVASLATSDPTKNKGRNLFGRTVVQNPPRNALDSLMNPIKTNLADTFSRYQFVALDQKARYRQDFLGKTFGVFSDEMRQLKKATISGDNLRIGLGVLESGGWPVRHMGLTGVVTGF